MANVTVNGIVILSQPFGEYDRRLEILTADYGRISVFASGARKPSSELVAPSRAFAMGSFELYQGRNSYNLRHAHIREYFTKLSDDIELTYYGFYFLELCRYFSRENVEAVDMLNLLYGALKALEKGIIDARLVRAVFELKMLALNGICPPEDKIINPQERFSTGAELNESTSYAIRFVLASQINKLFSFKLAEDVQQEFTGVVEHLMKLLVSHNFKSLEFLEF